MRVGVNQTQKYSEVTEVDNTGAGRSGTVGQPSNQLSSGDVDSSVLPRCYASAVDKASCPDDDALFHLPVFTSTPHPETEDLVVDR